MRFEGEHETVICEDCYRKISHLDDAGWDGTHLCTGCSARRTQNFVKSPCVICRKPMGERQYMWNCNGDTAHKSCVKKLPEKQQDEEEWSDEW